MSKSKRPSHSGPSQGRARRRNGVGDRPSPPRATDIELAVLVDGADAPEVPESAAPDGQPRTQAVAQLPAMEVPRYALEERAPTVKLRDKAILRLREGGLWIQNHDVERKLGYVPPPVGRIVRFATPGGDFVAFGFFHPASRIAGRVLSRNPELAIDREFFRRRLQNALDLRRRLRAVRPTDAWRWVNAEGDGLPGLIVDVYGAHLVVQINCAGFEAHRDMVFELCTELLQPAGVIERRDSGQRRAEGLATGPAQVIAGTAPPAPLWIEEGGLKLPVDLLGGQKTGLYLDQRDNRRRVADYIRAARYERIADLYCYNGGFGLAARAAGAARVCFVDRSEAAMDAARRAWRENGFADADAEFTVSAVNDFLANRPLPPASALDWDLAIIDPPKLTQGAIHAHKALQFHRKVNAAALKRIRSGGMIVSCDCSGAVSLADFQGALAAAAVDAGVRLKLLETAGGSADHPAPPGFRMGLYLKALFLEVQRD